MTVCGIKQADGVCVMGECPYIKKCCPVVWDKSGEPMTNEEWFATLSTEELAEFIRKQRDDWSDGWYSDWHPFSEIVEWLKEIHHDGNTSTN